MKQPITKYKTVCVIVEETYIKNFEKRTYLAVDKFEELWYLSQRTLNDTFELKQRSL